MQWKGTSVKALFGSSRAVAGVLLQAAGFLGAATIAVGTTTVGAQPRDTFYGFGRPYTPRSYYAPDYGSRLDDGYVDPLIRRTAEQLRRSPKPPPTKGPLLVAISLSKQQLTLYDNGVAIAQSRISSGTASYPTPTGVFSVIQKQRWHRSNLYSDAPMPFMQRVTWSGVALHAGKLPGYPASHGCIRLPDDFAVRLFRTTAIGARVVISQRDIAPVEISHPRLFTLPAPDAVPMAQAKPSVQPVSSAAAAPAAGMPAAAPLDPGAVSAEAGAKAETRIASAAPVTPGAATDAPAVEKTLRAGPVSVFVSRKEQRLYVRKGFEPVFDMPVTIQNPDQPLGTHLFIAMNPSEGSTAARWMVVSPPVKESGIVNAVRRDPSAKRSKNAKAPAAPVAPPAQTPAAASAALDRIELPPEAVTRISELMTVGAALTISDEGLGPETGKETDFTVVTSPIQPTKKAKPASDRYDRYERYDPFEADRYYRSGRRWF